MFDGGDLRRDAKRQRGVLEGHRDGVVRHRLNRNLRALRDFGFDVVLRRDARRRQDAALAVALERAQVDVEIQRAVDRAEREANRRRVREVDAAGAGASRRALLGNARPVLVPNCGIDVAVEAPLNAELARAVAVQLHDARFDLDLRLRAIERADQVRGAVGCDRRGRE